MLENVRLLLPESAGHKAVSLLAYREPFKFAVSVDCHGLAEDFQEDLEFRFSLGFNQLVRRFLQLRRAALGHDNQQSLSYLPRTLSSSGIFFQYFFHSSTFLHFTVQGRRQS